MRSPRPEPETAVASKSTVVAAPGLPDRVPARHGDALVELQRRYGNRRARGAIQAKLDVGPADDPYEREADRMSMLATGATVQRAPAPVGHLPGAVGGTADPALAGAVRRAGGSGGRAVPDGIRERMERVSGADLSPVRVHADAEADRLNDALGSRAFTVGADVFVRRSEYRPGTARGDALLGHELTHTIQQGAVRSSGTTPARTTPLSTPTAQRLFGFEFELRVPAFSRQGEEEHYPRHGSGVPRVGTATDRSFEIHLDHDKAVLPTMPTSTHWRNNVAIIELVTRPMDELTESDAEVRGVLQNLVNVADHIRNNALDQNTDIPLDNLPGVTARPAGVNFVGHETDVTPSPLTVDANVQQTYGVSLRKLRDEFTDRAQTPDSGTRYNEYKKFLARSDTIGQTLVKMIRDDLANEGREGRYGTDAQLEEAGGLLALMAYYLLCGNTPLMTGLLKNQTGIFYYKTKLSTVRNAIAGVRFPSLAAVRLAVAGPSRGLERMFEERRADLSKWLLAATEREPGDPVFNDLEAPKIDITCATWIESVLRGKRDQVYEQSVNPYSRELKAPDVGRGASRGHGVVMEDRRFAESQGNPYAHRYPPADWPGLAADLRQHLLGRQGQ